MYVPSSSSPATSSVLGDGKADLERTEGDLNRYDDPFSLRSGYVAPEQLSRLTKLKNGKKVRAYQRKQNKLIENVLKPMEAHTSEAAATVEQSRIPVKIAIWSSLIANLCLCVLQLYAAVSSASLSILSTGVDSIFDLGSNILLFYMHRKAARLDSNKWPVGGSRLEPIANIIYGSLMSSVNLIVVVESVQRLVTHDGSDLNKLHIPSLVAVGAALGVKFLLFLYCLSLRKRSSQVHVLWEDHRNDLIINTFAILMSAGGSRLRWWLDPMGGLLISFGVIAAWTKTIAEQFALLAGKSAPHDFIQLIIYKAMTFSEEIESIDTVRAYHSGPDYFVEIDVVMPANTELWKAHDLAQQLQDQIEVMPRVERAFVHVDHEATHRPEHRKEK